MSKCRHYYNGESFIDDDDWNMFETCQLCWEPKKEPE